MRRATSWACAAALVFWTVGLAAQTRPNFSGTWNLVPAADAAAAPAGGGGRGGRGGGRGGLGQTFTATQDATTLTITRTAFGDQTITATYKLDGSESTNTMMGRGGETQQVSTASWDGNRLVIVTQTGNGESRMVLSMQGANLVIEATNPGRGGGEPTTTTQTYTKG